MARDEMALDEARDVSGRGEREVREVTRVIR